MDHCFSPILSLLLAILLGMILAWLEPISGTMLTGLLSAIILIFGLIRRSVILICVGCILLSMHYHQWLFVKLAHNPFEELAKSMGIDDWKKHKINVKLAGTVTNWPIIQGHFTSFRFHADDCNHALCDLNLVLYGKDLDIQPGDHYHLSARIHAWHENRQPFVYHHHLLTSASRSFDASGYVTQNPKMTQIAHHHSWRWQRHLDIQTHSPTHLQGIINGVTLGVNTQIKNLQRQWFNATGTAHLIAISGLHMALFFDQAYRVSHKLWRLWPRGCRFIAAPYIGNICGLMTTLAYGFMADWPLPCQRSFIMLSCCKSLPLLKIYWPRHMVLIISFILMSLLEPLAWLKAGFWLSFNAISVIYMVDEKYRNRHFLTKQCAIALGMMPLEAIIFNRLSLIGIPCNLIAITLFTWLIIPLSLAVVLLDALHLSCGVLWSILNGTLDFLLQALPQHPERFMVIISDRYLCVCVVSLLTAGSLCLTKTKNSLAALCLVLGLGWIAHDHNTSKKSWDLHVLSVGQGLACIIHTYDYTMVYDTGPRYLNGGDMVQRVILPMLYYLGIDHIDDLIISHGDMDHRGGLLSLANNIGITRLWSGEPQRLEIKHARSCPTEIMQIGKIRITPFNLSDIPYRGHNDHSCVIQIKGAGKSVLLAGDISSYRQRALIKRYGKLLQSDLLIAPHHGSKDACDIGFLKTVQPKKIIYSTGWLNQFHFPSKRCQMRCQYLGIAQGDTGLQGTISMHFQGA